MGSKFNSTRLATLFRRSGAGRRARASLDARGQWPGWPEQRRRANDCARSAAAAEHTLALAFYGGEGVLHTTGEAEAVQAEAFFTSLGVPAQRMQFEDASRTTYENASYTARLPGVDKTRPWLLVTSAWHMPRALVTFNAAGWNVSAYPVDYRAGTHTPRVKYSLAQSALRWQLVLHEWVGRWAYRLAGRA